MRELGNEGENELEKSRKVLKRYSWDRVKNLRWRDKDRDHGDMVRARVMRAGAADRDWVESTMCCLNIF